MKALLYVWRMYRKFTVRKAIRNWATEMGKTKLEYEQSLKEKRHER